MVSKKACAFTSVAPPPPSRSLGSKARRLTTRLLAAGVRSGEMCSAASAAARRGGSCSSASTVCTRSGSSQVSSEWSIAPKAHQSTGKP